MRNSIPLRSVKNLVYERVRLNLHKLWTKVVGRPDYAKSEWSELENSIQALAQEADRRRGSQGC
jgi:hypothetical protein